MNENILWYYDKILTIIPGIVNLENSEEVLRLRGVF